MSYNLYYENYNPYICIKIRKIMESLLHDMRILLDSLPAKIKKSNFKPQAIIKMTGMPSATFYKRMKTKTFTLEEAEKVLKILNFEKKIEDEINAGYDDLEKGRVQTIEELEQKYEN